MKTDDGTELNAEFEIEADGDHLALLLQSAGGRVGGSRYGRNHQYNDALELLLIRLRERGAVLESGVVDSRPARLLSEEQRTILTSPVVLAEVHDIPAFRLKLGRAQGGVGESPDGNATKRIRLRLSVPGCSAADARRLAADLAEPANHDRVPEALPLIRSLIGDPLSTVSGQENVVLAVDEKRALVATKRSPRGQHVDIAFVENGLAKLYGRGSVQVNVAELGHRSAFVGAVLATLPGTTLSENPATVTLHAPESPPSVRQFPVLDGSAHVKIRKEQAELRRSLLNGRASAPCDLCGDEYPGEFLVAAHVKRRAICTDEERNDLANVAMLACKFGCDSLFETGHVAVDDSGHVLSSTEDVLHERLLDHLKRLHGRPCSAHRSSSAAYFAWHRVNVYRGRVSFGTH
ncbi:hypothetical protein [Umezawaea beigongshangensis]|uniref:hypothetical protein n=1 Tax=Umezawaea beigongshangensis TaxID=2780383 RepID=UPI0018F11ECB|nr:hypothetical protein [Umezawaea beigongshangensis]